MLFLPKVRNNRSWRATVTPLASIIGSGFLVVAPLLGSILGPLAPPGMLLVLLAAYAIGAVIRFNIRYAEPVLEKEDGPVALRFTERLSNVALSIAYVISVTFYLRLLSAFVLEALGHKTGTAADLLTTIIILFIGTAGWRRGFRVLERLEEYSVSVKLAIICALLVGLGHYDFTGRLAVGVAASQDHATWDTLRLLAGVLLIVQGFETSRYLGEAYGPEERIRSMRLAQLVSGLIYISFVILVLPLLHFMSLHEPDETAIMAIAGHAASILPVMLVIAAVMSQFSAAVADTAGAGGLVSEYTRHRISPDSGYLLVMACAIGLVWTTDIFEIVALASRAFAAYYLAQTLVAWQVAGSGCLDGRRRRLCQAGFGLLAVALLGVVLFAQPAG